MYWNANSLHEKILELYTFLLDNDVHIACVCETFFSPCDIVHKHPKFYVHRLDRPENDTDRRSGGVAIVIRRNIRHSLLTVPTTNLIEAMGVQINFLNGLCIKVYSIYVPGGASNYDIQQHFENDLKLLHSHSKQRFYICGDFNAKHRLWNCVRANLAG